MLPPPMQTRLTPARELHRPYAAWLVGVAVIASLLDFVPFVITLPGRAGMHWGALAAALCTLVVIGGGDRKIGGGGWKRLGKSASHRRITWALTAVALAYQVSSAGAANAGLALAEAVRVAVVGLFFLATLLVEDRAALRTVLARVAAGIIVGCAFVWLVGVLSSSMRQALFELGQHHNLGALPRFRGLSPNPFSLGALLLVCAAMVGWLPGRAGQVLRWLALVLVGLTLSFASVVLPVWLVVQFVQRPKPRRFAVALATLAALTVLFAYPLTVEFNDQRVEVGQRHPSDRLERRMPSAHVRLGPVGVEVLATRYGVLTARAVSCWQARPLLGVGGRNFATSCPVLQMAPSGTWDRHSRSHSQYGGMLAETGIVGVLAALALIWALRKGTRIDTSTSAHRACMTAYLVASFAGDIWFLLPFAAWLGAALTTTRTSP